MPCLENDIKVKSKLVEAYFHLTSKTVVLVGASNKSSGIIPEFEPGSSGWHADASPLSHEQLHRLLGPKRIRILAVQRIKRSRTNNLRFEYLRGFVRYINVVNTWLPVSLVSYILLNK